MQDNGDSPCLVCSETIPGEPGTLGKDNDLVGSMETPELQTLNQIETAVSERAYFTKYASDSVLLNFLGKVLDYYTRHFLWLHQSSHHRPFCMGQISGFIRSS